MKTLLLAIVLISPMNQAPAKSIRLRQIKRIYMGSKRMLSSKSTPTAKNTTVNIDADISVETPRITWVWDRDENLKRAYNPLASAISKAQSGAHHLLKELTSLENCLLYVACIFPEPSTNVVALCIGLPFIYAAEGYRLGPLAPTNMETTIKKLNKKFRPNLSVGTQETAITVGRVVLTCIIGGYVLFNYKNVATDKAKSEETSETEPPPSGQARGLPSETNCT